MSDDIRSAVYSNIHVYEILVRGIPVMIRKSDSWVNATQILRAAGLPKPARTKVLEREVTRGIHEKVQGGYAGSQGTWIPLETAKTLAEEYGVAGACAPLFEYDMKSGKAESISPPVKIRKVVKVNSDLESSIGFFSINEDDELISPDKSEEYPIQKHMKLSNGATDEEDDEDYGYTPKPRPTKRRFGSRPKRIDNEDRTFSTKPERQCEVCHVTETPQWRRGPSGKRTLCNACGVKWSNGRLHIDKPPGSPFLFTTTESEALESSDASGFEEIEVGSAAWKLQLEVGRLKSKLREVERNQKRLSKLISESIITDRKIDRNYRSLISTAKQSNVTDVAKDDLFHKEKKQRVVRFGDATTKDLLMEQLTLRRFRDVIQRK